MFQLTELQREALLREIAKLPEEDVPSNIPRNRIIYGAPGTGKSYLLDDARRRYFPKDAQFVRVTFHPNYSYSQFVGSYKPFPLYRDGDSGKSYYSSDMELIEKREPLIDYKFVPGPFIELLIKSLQNRKSNFLLLIEEINRANAAAVFGDVFQLLDRKSDGESEYSITFARDAMNYMRSVGIRQHQIRIPQNLYIWATMNSADQGVMPLDTAFKRRWSFEYVPLNLGADIMDRYYIKPKFLTTPIKWNQLRNAVNDRLIAADIPEDKLIGPFFLKPHELLDSPDDSSDFSIDTFKNKLLLYLKDDVLRHTPGKIFEDGLKTFSKIIEAYDKGDNVFNFTISNQAI